jgi:trans-2,3-dihydro-3-hydroxyanthranilate isomerase
MPRRIPFFVVDAFTDTPFQGNPAGVFFDEDPANLTDAERMRLCAEISLESAFVSPGGEDGGFRLRYFTGVTEVPLCGHATVATAAVLAHTGRTPHDGQVIIRNNLGRMPIGVRQSGALTSITMFLNAGTFTPPLLEGVVSEVGAALGVPAAADGLPVQVVSTGTPWLLFPVADRTAVDGIEAARRAEAIIALSRKYDTFGAYVFTVEKTETDGISIWSRCFAPIADLPEDPVTGSASGSLAWYLAEHGILPDGAEAIVQQGFAGGRGGTARIRIADGWGPEVSGTAILVAEGTFTLP